MKGITRKHTRPQTPGSGQSLVLVISKYSGWLLMRVNSNPSPNIHCLLIRTIQHTIFLTTYRISSSAFCIYPYLLSLLQRPQSLCKGQRHWLGYLFRMQKCKDSPQHSRSIHPYYPSWYIYNLYMLFLFPTCSLDIHIFVCLIIKDLILIIILLIS